MLYCSEDMEHGASCCSAPHLQSPRACDAAVRISQGDVKEAAQKVGFADAESFSSHPAVEAVAAMHVGQMLYTCSLPDVSGHLTPLGCLK